MIAKLKQFRISPKKANLVAQLVRRKQYQEAVQMLKFTNKKAAPVLKTLIESAAANAIHNLKQKKEDLYIKEIIVTEGPTYKRHLPISKGRVHPILKRTSHITVKLGSAGTVEKAVKKVEPKKEETPSEQKETNTDK